MPVYLLCSFFTCVNIACIWGKANTFLLFFYFRCSYSKEYIPSSLCVFLDTVKQCLCGNYCFKSCVHHIVTINIHHLAHTVVSVCPTQSHLPAEGFLCSRKCLQRLKNSKRSYWQQKHNGVSPRESCIRVPAETFVSRRVFHDCKTE